MPETLQLPVLHRDFKIDRKAINEESRTIDVCFSTADPAPRWFGLEILSHESGACDLSRLNDGGAFLKDHNPREQIGVVVKATIESDRRGKAKLRFGRSPVAEQEWQDVRDSIRTKVSVGYVVETIEEETARRTANPSFV
jgi:hypothetical protein